MKTRPLIAGVAAAALLAAVFTPVASSAQEGPSTVRVVHAYAPDGEGIGSTPVTVCAGGEVLDGDFTVGQELGPIEVEPGPLDVAILGPGQPCDAIPDLADTLDVAAGQTLTIVAASDVAGRLVLDIYEEDTDCIDAGAGRVVARHAASASATGTPDAVVSIVALGVVLVEELQNGQEFVADVPADTYEVSVTAPGTTEPAILGPLSAEVVAGQQLEVYAIGAAGSSVLQAFTLTRPLDTCEEPVPTTTTIVTATTTPPAQHSPAAAVQSQPRFTG